MYTLDYSNKDPIYQQIVDQTKSAILKGYYKDKDQMPSVRELAKTLLVNTSTVSRAYSELEKMGIVQTIAGKGTFILFDPKIIKWEKEKILEKLEEVFKECLLLDISKDDIIKVLEKIEEEVVKK